MSISFVAVSAFAEPVRSSHRSGFQDPIVTRAQTISPWALEKAASEPTASQPQARVQPSHAQEAAVPPAAPAARAAPAVPAVATVDPGDDEEDFESDEEYVD